MVSRMMMTNGGKRIGVPSLPLLTTSWSRLAPRPSMWSSSSYPSLTSSNLIKAKSTPPYQYDWSLPIHRPVDIVARGVPNLVKIDSATLDAPTSREIVLALVAPTGIPNAPTEQVFLPDKKFIQHLTGSNSGPWHLVYREHVKELPWPIAFVSEESLRAERRRIRIEEAKLGVLIVAFCAGIVAGANVLH